MHKTTRLEGTSYHLFGYSKFILGAGKPAWDGNQYDREYFPAGRLLKGLKYWFVIIIQNTVKRQQDSAPQNTSAAYVRSMSTWHPSITIQVVHLLKIPCIFSLPCLTFAQEETDIWSRTSVPVDYLKWGVRLQCKVNQNRPGLIYRSLSPTLKS